MRFFWRCFANQQSVRKCSYSTYYVTTPIFYVNAGKFRFHFDLRSGYKRNIERNGRNIGWFKQLRELAK